MKNTVGLRFVPTDEELVDHYLRPKNLGGSTTTHIDQVISTVNICNFDPWELPRQSRMASSDQVWYFFGPKDRRYNSGERQRRTTKSGYWRKTGVTVPIKRKQGNREKIGEKKFFVFYENGSKSKWVMHEYHASPHQSVTFTVCKVQLKGETSSSGIEMVEHSHSLVTPMNNPGELSIGSEELQSPRHQEMQLEEFQTDFDNLSSYNWENLL